MEQQQLPPNNYNVHNNSAHKIPEMQINLSGTIRKIQKQKEEQKSIKDHLKNSKHDTIESQKMSNTNRTIQHKSVPEMTIYLEDILQS